MVLGASFYCTRTSTCRFFRSCTSKDSSPYDTICPAYSGSGICLHDEPKNVLNSSTHKRFISVLKELLDSNSDEEAWSHLAFTNYVQFFLPANKERFRKTNHGDISERDFEAFIEVVRKLSPDIIIVWGCVINSYIKEINPYVYDKDELEKNEGYLCHMKLDDHKMAIVNPYHPSSRFWFSGKKDFLFYLEQALNE